MGSFIVVLIGASVTDDIVSIGIRTGFCGCLTTVSTFMKETVTMFKANSFAHLYIFLTVMVAQLLVFIVNCIDVWG